MGQRWLGPNPRLALVVVTATAIGAVGAGIAVAGGGTELVHSSGVADGAGGVTALAEPYDVSLSPDGKFVYATSYSENAVTVLERDKPGEDLSFVQTYQDGVGGVHDFSGLRSVKIAPDGRRAYVTATGSNSLHILKRNGATGMLHSERIKFNGQAGVKGLAVPHDIAVSPDSKFVYVAGRGSGSIVVFKRAANGNHPYVGKVSGNPGLNAPFDLAISRDGRNVYAVSQLPGAVVAYKRNKTTGKLAHLQSLRDDRGTTDYIANASGITISRDGKNVYVAAPDDSALNVFRRNTSSGRLSFIQVIRDGVGEVGDFATPQDVVVTPDGRSVYAAAFLDDALVSFNRKLSNGRLTYAARVDEAEVGDLFGIWRLAADNQGVFGASIYDHAIAPFRRTSS